MLKIVYQSNSVLYYYCRSSSSLLLLPACNQLVLLLIEIIRKNKNIRIGITFLNSFVSCLKVVSLLDLK